MALRYFQKGLQVRWKSLLKKDLVFASIYNNMGLVHQQQKYYTQPLKYHRRSLHIKRLHLLSNHPELGSSYNNIALIYYHKTNNYAKALKNPFKFDFNHYRPVILI